jgi:hypothetical protein
MPIAITAVLQRAEQARVELNNTAATAPIPQLAQTAAPSRNAGRRGGRMINANDVTPIVTTKILQDVSASDGESPKSLSSPSCASSTSAIVRPAHGHGTSE